MERKQFKILNINTPQATIQVKTQNKIKPQKEKTKATSYKQNGPC